VSRFELRMGEPGFANEAVQNSRFRDRCRKHHRCIGAYGHPQLPHDCRVSAARVSLDCRSAEFSGAIRNARRQPGAMSNNDLSKVLSGLKAQPYGGRSALYRWLRANHRRLSRRLAKDQTSWTVTASEIAAVGITNTKGGPPSSDSVRRVWATVCRDVEADRSAKIVNPKRKPPSRISPDWRPTVVPPPPIRAEPAPAGSSSPSAASTDPRAPSRDPDMTPEGQAVLDKAWEALLGADRKKFGF